MINWINLDDNYWQEYDLNPSLNDMTNVKQENLDNLVKVGNNLLQQKVKRINVNTLEPYEIDQTNAKAIERCVHSWSSQETKYFYYTYKCLKYFLIWWSFAEKLYEEKQLRLKKEKSMKKAGRPFVEAVRAPFSGNHATY